ncbi:MAG: DNA mismatch repair endonuclease MutL [Bacteroidetes bacterium]|nr:DNA mismatch repair endonuclease MutL [Bacteroidota bacterium]
MSDLIRLLPDSVANQIAAGEVIQRPASAVKELLENAVDAGATQIKLIIKDAGKSLIQVIDNGCGMSERDARMCFERHATSKIETANDLLSIHTLGFRGEALASVASIAQTELRSKRTEDEIGTSIIIEGSEFKGQSPVSTPDGTSISIKNLFFNVPARRNFLKSNTLELKYIVEEFLRVALVNPEIVFTFYNQERILHQVPASNLKQRLVALLGNNYNQRLIPVDQETGIVNIHGFIGKPEFAKKTRGEQYFFTNGRFIKNPYLHHAIENAFQQLIPKDAFPTYFIYMTVDPQTIDVNIHPTKTEINFQDIRSIYAILHAAIRQSIGKFNITPTLDFETEPSMEIPPLPEGGTVRQPTITVDPEYNPFEKKVRPQFEIPLPPRSKGNEEQWKGLYDPLKDIHFKAGPEPQEEKSRQHVLADWDTEHEARGTILPFQALNRYIVGATKSGVVIIDPQRARERIFYERLLSTLEQNRPPMQHQLHPQTIQLAPEDFELVMDMKESFFKAGFDYRSFGKNTIVVDAIPADCEEGNMTGLFESILEGLKSGTDDGKTKLQTRVILSLAKSMSASGRQKLQPKEMEALVEQLFACSVPDLAPDGKPILMLIGFDELNKKFK